MKRPGAHSPSTVGRGVGENIGIGSGDGAAVGIRVFGVTAEKRTNEPASVGWRAYHPAQSSVHWDSSCRKTVRASKSCLVHTSNIYTSRMSLHTCRWDTRCTLAKCLRSAGSVPMSIGRKTAAEKLKWNPFFPCDVGTFLAGSEDTRLLVQAWPQRPPALETGA